MRTITAFVIFAFVFLPIRAELFPITLNGAPTIRLVLDRKYEVAEISQKAGAPKKDLRAFMFIPKDDQSSAVLGIGRDGFRKTEEMIVKMYGGGAKVTKVAGRIAGKNAEWWHYRDSKHLYSTCEVTLPDASGLARLVYFDLVANTPERLFALEESFARIVLE